MAARGLYFKSYRSINEGTSIVSDNLWYFESCSYTVVYSVFSFKNMIQNLNRGNGKVSVSHYMKIFGTDQTYGGPSQTIWMHICRVLTL